jgi:hypothetical protein
MVMGSTDLDSDIESLLLPQTPVIVHHAVYPYYNLGAPSLPPPRVLSQRLCIYTTDKQRPRYYAGGISGTNSGLLSMPASPHGAAVTGTGVSRAGVASGNSPSAAASAAAGAAAYSNASSSAAGSSDAAVAVVASPQSALKRPFSKLSIRKFGSIGGSVPPDSTSLNSPSNSSKQRRETAGGETSSSSSVLSTRAKPESPRRVANIHERPKIEDVAQRRGKSTGGRGGY